jgi:CheY-like chemotaxis protein
VSEKNRKSAVLDDAGTVDVITEVRRQEALLKTGALQNAILNSANFSSIATDEKGVIQIFNVGAERKRLDQALQEKNVELESARSVAEKANLAKSDFLSSVEDNPANLKLVEQIIARHPDIRLLTAVTGDRGVEIARVSEPEVILMDINLPGINGFEALKILRSDPATARIPVIAISANAMPLDIERGLKAGFFRYITKPIKVNEFKEALDMALEFAGKASAKGK